MVSSFIVVEVPEQAGATAVGAGEIARQAGLLEGVEGSGVDVELLEEQRGAKRRRDGAAGLNDRRVAVIGAPLESASDGRLPAIGGLVAELTAHGFEDHVQFAYGFELVGEIS